MTDEQLVARIKAGVDVSDNMAQLYIQFKPYLNKMANKYSAYAEYDDLMQEGYFGLNDAVEHYKEGMGSVFNYATYWIRNSMVRYIKESGSLIRIPSNMRDEIKKYRKFVADFEAYNGREPTDKEAGYYLMKSEEDIRFLKKSHCMNNMQSLDMPVTDEGEAKLYEVIPGEDDVEDAVLDRMNREQMKQDIWECVDNLPGKQPEILHLMYEQGMTGKSIGEGMRMTEGAVYQQSLSAYRALRRGKNRRMLLPYCNEYVACHAYDSGNEWDSITERLAMYELETERRSGRDTNLILK